MPLGRTFDLIFKLAVSLGHLLGHLIGTKRGVPIRADRVQENSLTELEFVSGAGVIAPVLFGIAVLQIFAHDFNSPPCDGRAFYDPLPKKESHQIVFDYSII
jgi:hypothetical protein